MDILSKDTLGKCSREELLDLCLVLSQENKQLHEIGARYSGTRELAARGVLLRVQSALSVWRLSGKTHLMQDLDDQITEFMRTGQAPTPAEDALNFAITYLIHGSADESELPEGLVAYFKEKADALRVQAK
jgi:hypothetical protein